MLRSFTSCRRGTSSVVEELQEAGGVGCRAGDRGAIGGVGEDAAQRGAGRVGRGDASDQAQEEAVAPQKMFCDWRCETSGR